MIRQFQTGELLKQNRYRIDAKYHEGGQAFVYLATDLKASETVIIKQNKENEAGYRNAINQEREVLMNLKHPFLPRVYDFFAELEFTFLVMSYIVGEDLDFLVANKKTPFSAVEVIPWIAQLLEILAELQEQVSLVHGDIKPKNVRLGRDGNIYLLDFGLTTKVGDRNAFVIGTSPNYSSPEQFRDDILTQASDVYSLGATAYYLLTRTPPADANVRQKNIQDNLTDPLIPIRKINPEIPVKLAELIEIALSVERVNRPQNAKEMSLWLQRVLETNVYERLDETETQITLRDGTRINIPITPKFSEIPTEKMDFQNKAFFNNSPPTAQFFTQDATVEALQLIQLIQENSSIVQNVAHIIAKVIDSSPEKRKNIVSQFSGHISTYSATEISVVTNFLNKLANHSICDAKIQQQLRHLLQEIGVSNLAKPKPDIHKEISVESPEVKEKIEKINYNIFVRLVQGVLVSLPVFSFFAGAFNEWISMVPSGAFVFLWIILAIIPLFVFFALTKGNNRKNLFRLLLAWELIVYLLSFLFGIFLGGVMILMILKLVGMI
jgi:serine/threonine protein kinase